MHKYQWLENRLELLIQNQIQNGKDKLPSEQELCERYQISRQTVRTALNSLEEKGMIRKTGKRFLYHRKDGRFLWE